MQGTTHCKRLRRLIRQSWEAALPPCLDSRTIFAEGEIPGVTANASLKLSTGTRLTVVFPTALLGFLLWALPCLSTGTRLTVVLLTFSVPAQGRGRVISLRY